MLSALPHLVFLVTAGAVSQPSFFRPRTTLTLKTQDADFFGDLRFPILFDTPLFIPQACLPSTTETLFVRTLSSICYATQAASDLSLAFFASEVNAVCAFNRFN